MWWKGWFACHCASNSITQPNMSLPEKAAPKGRFSPYFINRIHAANVASNAARVVQSMSIVIAIFIGVVPAFRMARCSRIGPFCLSPGATSRRAGCVTPATGNWLRSLHSSVGEGKAKGIYFKGYACNMQALSQRRKSPRPALARKWLTLKDADPNPNLALFRF